MERLIEEGSDLIEEDFDPEAKDAGLIAAAQRVEHYEMAVYGTARTYADIRGDKKAASLLQETLDEERNRVETYRSGRKNQRQSRRGGSALTIPCGIRPGSAVRPEPARARQYPYPACRGKSRA